MYGRLPRAMKAIVKGDGAPELVLKLADRPLELASGGQRSDG